MDRKRIISVVLWVCLYAAFLAVAIIVRNHVVDTGTMEIRGWDYHTFVEQIQDWRYISYFGFRHPGLGVVLSPLVALEHLWSGAYLVVMPGVAVLTAYLIHRMAGLLGLIVWISFPVTWLMAAIPESFPVAQLSLVGSLFLLDGKYLSKTAGVEVSLRRIVLLVIVNSMITLTNGIKPFLAYVFRCRNRRKLMMVGLVVGLIALGGVSFFYVRSIVCGRSYLAGIEMTLSWIPENRNLLQELYGFFVRPVGLPQSFIVYPLLVCSLFSHRLRDSYARIQNLLAFFSVDALLHLVIGWGMSEPWVFAPHWIFIIPIIIGNGIPLNCSVRA